MSRDLWRRLPYRSDLRRARAAFHAASGSRILKLMGYAAQTPPTHYVEIRQNRLGRPRAFVTGTRVRIQEIAILHERFGESAEEIATSHFPQLTLAQVHGALAYFFEAPEAIWEAVREDRATALELKNQQDVSGHSEPRESAVSS